MQRVAVTGSGLYAPPETISNEELVASFNAYVERHNREHAAGITAGSMTALQPSSSDFIVKASGIRSRHVIDKQGLLDISRMHPRVRARRDDEPSFMCEMGLAAARQALQAAGRGPQDVDGVLVACSNMQRAYPAIAIELQHYLGIQGYAYDMNVACASAAFGLQAAVDAVRDKSARAVLVVSPEIVTGHIDFRNRDSHFIFGDACTAVLVEALDRAGGETAFEVLGTRLRTQFSNNIRNNFGFLNASEYPARPRQDCLFRQEGRKVFKDVVLLVTDLIAGHLGDLGLTPQHIRRLWLHQANINMNQLIASRVLGREPSAEEAPMVLDEYANTSAAGSVIAFHKHHRDLQRGDVGVLSAYGAGYSAGSVVLRRC